MTRPPFWIVAVAALIVGWLLAELGEANAHAGVIAALSVGILHGMTYPGEREP